MIHINLVKKSNLSKKTFKKICGDYDPNTIVLFPGIAFRKKFDYFEIKDYLRDINLSRGTIVLFSAYILNENSSSKECVDLSISDNDETSTLCEDPSNERYLPGFVNYGFILDSSKNFIKYEKIVCSQIDSVNRNSEKFKVKKPFFNFDSLDKILDVDFENPSIDFPTLNVEGKSIEFRVSEDIGCRSSNSPDLVLVSAYKLSNVRRVISPPLKETPIIVNDSCRLFSPCGYLGKTKVRSKRELFEMTNIYFS